MKGDFCYFKNAPAPPTANFYNYLFLTLLPHSWGQIVFQKCC